MTPPARAAGPCPRGASGLHLASGPPRASTLHPLPERAPLAAGQRARHGQHLARRLVPAGLTLLLGVATASAPRAALPPPSAAAAAQPRAATPAPAATLAIAITRAGAIETSVAHLPGRLLASAVARDAAGRHGLVLLVADVTARAAAASGTGVDTRTAAPAAGQDPPAGQGPPASQGLRASKDQPANQDPPASQDPPAARDPAAGNDPAESGPRSLYFLVPGSLALERLAAALPERTNAVAALIPAAGGAADPLIVGEPGALYVVDLPREGGTGSCRKLLAAPGLDLRSLRLASSGAPRPRLPWLAVARAGRLELLASDPASPPPLRELRPIASFPLPLTAEHEPWGIKLTSSPVHLLPEPAGPAAVAVPASGPSQPAAPRFAMGPEPQGRRRLRTLLLAAAAGEPPVEAWSLLQGDAQDLDGSFLDWAGRPALVVSSVPKFGVFVKRDLQLFVLARDRSRGGAPPAFAVHTECLLWHELGTYFAAAASSRGRDLVVIYPEGMGGKKLHVLAYADMGQGRLAAQPRVSSVDVEADAWFYGADLTGDGIADLLVKSQGRLLLYPGVANAYRLADRPAWNFALPLPPPRAKARRGDRSGDTEEARQEDRQERASRAAAARLAGLVDLSGDGHSTLFLGVASDRDHTAVVAVRRTTMQPPR